MWSLGVVMTDPGVGDVIELVSAEAHEVIEALPFYGADERLREGVRLGRSDRTAQPLSTV